MYYRKQPVRHFHEVIMTGKACRLYFDLEYNVNLNPDFSVQEFYPKFYKILEDLLKHFFGIEESCMIVLDSSTKDKFSNHIIVHTEKLFPSNTELNPFVKILAQEMRSKGAGIVCNHDTSNALILDLGVYSKNQNFRLYGSTNFGHSAVLDLSEETKVHAGSSMSNF